jgi:hypothetical protein
VRCRVDPPRQRRGNEAEEPTLVPTWGKVSAGEVQHQSHPWSGRSQFQLQTKDRTVLSNDHDAIDVKWEAPKQDSADKGDGLAAMYRERI